jgi:hypothetical protein
MIDIFRWLLKLHGTVSRPHEIVLTKRDYIRYNDRFAALAGIVQSTLLTRHLLSVGFSLDDDNFQKIFDSVRKAKTREHELLPSNHSAPSSSSKSIPRNLFPSIRAAERSRFDEDSDDIPVGNNWSNLPSEETSYCTALILKYSHLKHLEWENEIDIQYIQQKDLASTETNYPEWARKQEIFIDLLASFCSSNESTKFLMKERYSDALSDEDREMKEFVSMMTEKLLQVSPEAKKTKAYEHLKRSIQELGG